MIENFDVQKNVEKKEIFSKFIDFSSDTKIENKTTVYEDFSHDVISGIERGKEMTFTEADSGNVNPNYEECEGFQCNCQTCVVVFEARLRGYDIEAKAYTVGSNFEKLAEQTNLAWIDKEGKHPDYIYNLDVNSTDSMYDFISDTVKSGERYTMEGLWKGPWGFGHIISVFREDSGNLVFYDPQINRTYNKRSVKEEILSNMQKGTTESTTIKLLRVDNLEIDKTFVDSLVRGKEEYA